MSLKIVIIVPNNCSLSRAVVLACLTTRLSALSAGSRSGGLASSSPTTQRASSAFLKIALHSSTSTESRADR